MAAHDPQISCRVRSPATVRDASGMWRTPTTDGFEAAQGRRISVPNRRCRTFEGVPAPKAGRGRRKSEGERRCGARAQTFGDGTDDRSFRRRMGRNDAPQTFDRAWCGHYNFMCRGLRGRSRWTTSGARQANERRARTCASFPQAHACRPAGAFLYGAPIRCGLVRISTMPSTCMRQTVNPYPRQSSTAASNTAPILATAR